MRPSSRRAPSSCSELYERDTRTLTFSEYASWNHRVSERDALGRVIRYAWTSEERLASVIDAGGTSTEYRYDLAGRLTEVHRGGRLHERYSYDAAGNLVAKHDTHGDEVLRLEPGPGNKKRARLLASGDEQEFTYDECGRVLTATSEVGTCSFGYDLTGRLRFDLREGHGVHHGYGATGKLRESTVLGRFTTRYLLASSLAS